jgi:hypothetical protein
MRSQQPYRFDAPEFDYQASLQKQQAQEAADRDAAARARARRQIEANIQELQQRPCYREHMGRKPCSTANGLECANSLGASLTKCGRFS